MYGYIYITTNLVNGRKYIGQHKWSKYPSKHLTYFGSGKILKNAILKYGEENFSCRIIQWCHSKWELDAREKAWILMYDAVNSNEFYNISTGGSGGGSSWSNYTKPHPWIGKHHTEESKKKISENYKKQYKKENHPNFNKHLSQQTKEKQRTSAIKTAFQKSIFSENDIKEIVKLRSDGLLYKEIAVIFNISKSCVQGICEGRKWSNITGIIYKPKNHTKQGPLILDDEIVIKILADRKYNKTSYQKIADKFGVSKGCIQKICEGKSHKHIERSKI